jgi:hypothetical protein
MIKHFLKWLKLVPLLDHTNEGVTFAFFEMVFNRFGVLVEVLINQGMKFHWEFQELFEKTLINYCAT